jgi:hypothetical protein
MSEHMDNTPINFDKSFEEAKQKRWSDVKHHKKWFVEAAQFWGRDYARTGSSFSYDMMNQMHEFLSHLSDFQDYLERDDVVCMPKFPHYPSR